MLLEAHRSFVEDLALMLLELEDLDYNDIQALATLHGATPVPTPVPPLPMTQTPLSLNDDAAEVVAPLLKPYSVQALTIAAEIEEPEEVGLLANTLRFMKRKLRIK
jgi:hypothetical protein